MYSRGPVASAAPHLYAYFCLPEPAPPAAAPMSSFIVLATSMLGMAAPMVTMIGRRPNPTPPRPPRAWACRGTASLCCWRPRRRPRWSVWASRVCCCRGRPSRRRRLRGDGSSFPPLLCAPAMKESPDDAETDADELAHRLDHAGLLAARRARRRLASTGADGSRDLSAVAEVAPDHARRVWRSGRPCGRMWGHPSMVTAARDPIAPPTAVEAIVAAM